MKKKRIRIVRRLFLLLLTACVISAVVCRYHLKVSEYDVKLDGIRNDCTVVFLSDLHSLEYGNDNQRLLERIDSKKPDAIFVLGDMFNQDADEAEIDQFFRLMQHLKDIAPTYFSFGNQEMDYLLNGHDDFVAQLESQGITVLWDNYVETMLGGNQVRIGGSLGHYYGYHWTKKQKKNPPDYAMEESIGNTDIPSIVLLHMPETILFDGAVETWTGDLFLSGHTHGGVICIPGIGGLFSPTQGLFPKYDRGQFLVHDDRFPLIITSGLSGYRWLPRISNLPEICVLRLGS